MGSIGFGALVVDPWGSLGLEDSVLVPPMVDPWGPLGLELSWKIHGVRWVWRTPSLCLPWWIHGSIRFGALVADTRGSLGLEDSVLAPLITV